MPSFTLTSSTADRLGDFLNNVSPDQGPLHISVDTARMRFEDLAVLRDAFRILMDRGLHFHIAGVPPCVWQAHIGGRGYTHLLQIMEPDPGARFTVDHTGTFMPVSCRHCQVRASCPGLGAYPEKQKVLNFRIRKEERLEAWKTVHFKDGTLDRKYRTVLNHVDAHDNAVADRSIMYARTFSIDGPAQYTERFIYFCCYMPPGDIHIEKTFLCSMFRNSRYVADMFKRFYERKTVATVNGTFAAGRLGRESLYLYLMPDELRAFAGENGISPDYNAFEKPYLMGIDFFNGALAEFKAYYWIFDRALFRQYVEHEISSAFGDWFWELSCDGNVEIVRRFDTQGKYTGCRVGFGARQTDAVRHEIRSRFGVDFGPELENLVIYSYALGVSTGGDIIKATVYERPRFKGIDGDRI